MLLPHTCWYTTNLHATHLKQLLLPIHHRHAWLLLSSMQQLRGPNAAYESPMTTVETWGNLEMLQVGGVTMKSQKDITLGKDLSLQDRQGIYRNYLIYCMTGHVTVLPMGATGESHIAGLPPDSGLLHQPQPSKIQIVQQHVCMSA